MVEKLGDNHWVVPDKQYPSVKHHVQIRFNDISIFEHNGKEIDAGVDLAFDDFLQNEKWQKRVHDTFGADWLAEINDAVRAYQKNSHALEGINRKRAFQQQDIDKLAQIPEDSELARLVQNADINVWKDIKSQTNWKLECSDGTTVHQEYRGEEDAQNTENKERKQHTVFTKPDGTTLEPFEYWNPYFPVVIGNTIYDLGSFNPRKWDSNGELILKGYDPESDDPRYSEPNYYGLHLYRVKNAYVVGDRLIAEYELPEHGDHDNSVVGVFGTRGYIEYSTETLLPIGRCNK